MRQSPPLHPRPVNLLATLLAILACQVAAICQWSIYGNHRRVINACHLSDDVSLRRLPQASVRARLARDNRPDTWALVSI